MDKMKTCKVDYSRMSFMAMAAEMSKKLDEKNAEPGIYSLQVYEATSGDIDASELHREITGYVLYYYKYRPSRVIGYRTMMDQLTNNRKILWTAFNCPYILHLSK